MKKLLSAPITRVLIDRWAVHIDAYTWHRYRLTSAFLIRGPIDALNIGTGGGLETLRLLHRNNYVTTVEINETTAQRTRKRVERNDYGDKHRGIVGHVLEISLDDKFHEVLMCEVLEHVAEDFAALRRVSDWLLPGGRLVLSTPTASYGQLPNGTVSLEEDGGHVRVGYDGPELDEMLKEVGLIPLRRIYNGNRLVRWYHRFERTLRRGPARLFGYGFSFLSRPLLPILDLVSSQPYDQITLAVKRNRP